MALANCRQVQFTFDPDRPQGLAWAPMTVTAVFPYEINNPTGRRLLVHYHVSISDDRGNRTEDSNTYAYQVGEITQSFILPLFLSNGYAPGLVKFTAVIELSVINYPPSESCRSQGQGSYQIGQNPGFLPLRELFSTELESDKVARPD